MKIDRRPSVIGNVVNNDPQIASIGQTIIPKCQSIVDDCMASIRANMKTTQASVAGFYVTAGSLKGDLNKAYAAESAAYTKFETTTENTMKDAITAFRIELQNGVDNIVQYAQSKHIPQSTIDTTTANISDTLDQINAGIEQIAQDFYKSINDEVAKSHTTQNALCKQAATCTGNACTSLDNQWKQETARCAAQIQQYLNNFAVSMSSEVHICVTNLKHEINPISLGIQSVLGT